MLSATSQQPEPSDGLPIPQRYWGILTIALGLTMAVLDGAIANVALPTIAADLNTSPANSIWVVNAYQLAVTISLLPLASLGDIFGYRRVYQWGLVVFTLASLACALSYSLPTLALARVFQGFGAAGIMSVNSALVRLSIRGAGLGAGWGSTPRSARSRQRPARPPPQPSCRWRTGRGCSRSTCRSAPSRWWSRSARCRQPRGPG